MKSAVSPITCFLCWRKVFQASTQAWTYQLLNVHSTPDDGGPHDYAEHRTRSDQPAAIAYDLCQHLGVTTVTPHTPDIGYSVATEARVHADRMVFLDENLGRPKSLAAVGYRSRVGRLRAVEWRQRVGTVTEGLRSRLSAPA